MADISTWSPTRSWRWQACPRQFLLKDVLNAKPAQPDAPRVLRGQLMHAGMEGAMRAARDEVTITNFPNLPDMSVFFGDAQRAMTAHRAWPFLVSDADMADCSRIVHDCLSRLEVPPPSSILGVEQSFSFCHQALRHDGVIDLRIEGTVDLALRTGANSLRVIDWKTGSIPDRPELIEGRIALNVYSIAAMLLWPWATTVQVSLFSIPRGHSVNLVVTRETQAMALDRIAQDFQAAHEAMAALAPDTVDADFPTRSGDACISCVFRSYCPEFAQVALSVRRGVDVDAERNRIEAAISS